MTPSPLGVKIFLGVNWVKVNSVARNTWRTWNFPVGLEVLIETVPLDSLTVPPNFTNSTPLCQKIPTSLGEPGKALKTELTGNGEPEVP